ncbi:MAG: DegT/DnrJ/EryC1/StrS family aminotransferase [bacterium]
MTTVRLLDLQGELALYRAAALAAMERVVDSQVFIMGPEVAAFERELGAYADLPPAVGVSSGTDALLVALMALGIGPGDEVLTSPFTFFATAGAVARLGAKPVFADIDPGTFNLTEAGVRGGLTAATRAVIPVHLFGQLCDLGSFVGEAGRPAIIEDAAQALGATLRGQMTGHFGEMSTLSFFPSKNLGGFGDGGAVLVADADLRERLSVLRLHGSKPKYFHHFVGGNFRLDALQAAVLRVKLPLLDELAARRQANADRYDALFAEAGLIERGLVVPPVRLADAGHVFNQYVIRSADRDGLARALAEAGIETAIYYPRPLHLQPCFADLGHGPGDFPEAERACAEVLALPVHPLLTPAEQVRVVAAIRAHHGL